MVTEIVDLDLGSNSSFKIVTMEGDIRSRFIEFHLSYNGEVFNLQNKSVKCRYVNGRTTEEVNLVINDRVNGVCTLEIPYRITSIAQNRKCELVISQSGEILSTIPFSVEVAKSLVERATVESSNEFGALTNALLKIDGVNAELNNINSQLEHKMNLEAGKKAYIISGVIRNSGDGWELIDDEGHNSINITSVIQDEDNKTIAVVYPSAIKVGNFNVSPDETLAQMNVRCGASVSLNKASIKCFTDFTGYFNGSGLIVSQKGTWFDGTYTFTPLADGTGFNLIYDGDGSTIRPSVQVTSYADTGMNTQEMRVKANSSTSIDFRAYGDLEGKLICDGATFTLETPCVANISFSYTNGVLDITHLSGSTETEFNRFNNVQLTPFINDLSGEIVQPRVFGCTRNKIRIVFYDKTGTLITSATPLKNMSLTFTRPNLKVPQKIDKLGIWYFNCGSTILRPSKFISAGGNLWLTGTQQI